MSRFREPYFLTLYKMKKYSAKFECDFPKGVFEKIIQDEEGGAKLEIYLTKEQHNELKKAIKKN